MPSSRRQRLVAMLGFSLGLLWAVGASSPTKAQDREASRKHFKRGTALANQGNCADAIEAFETSIALFPVQNAFFNMGVCYQKLNRPLEAVNAFERLLGHFKDEAIPKRDEIERRLTVLYKTIGELTINVVPDGTGVYVDSEYRGISPLAGPIRLAPGQHRLQLRRNGYDTHDAELDVGAGTEMIIDVTLTAAVKSTPREKEIPPGAPLPGTTPVASLRADPAPLHSPPGNRPPPQKPSRRWRFITGAGLSVFGLSGIAVGAVFTKRGYDDRAALNAARYGSEETFNTLYDETLPRDQAMTIVGFSVGGTFLAVGTALIIWDRLLKRHEASTRYSLRLDAHFRPGVTICF